MCCIFDKISSKFIVFWQYLVVGGMPDAVVSFAENHNLNVTKIHKDIIDLYKLDFVIAYDGTILPIEVKSGKDYHIHSALNNCTYNDQYEIKEAFVFANCNVSRKEKITYLPIYMTMFMETTPSEEVILEKIEF